MPYVTNGTSRTVIMIAESGMILGNTYCHLPRTVLPAQGPGIQRWRLRRQLAALYPSGRSYH